MNSHYKIMFLRASNNHPVGCLAMRQMHNGVQYQLSTLNPSDNFDRRVARQLAIGRAVEMPNFISYNKNDIQSFNDVVALVMEDIISRKEVPNRSKIAAQNWLRTKPTQK